MLDSKLETVIAIVEHQIPRWIAIAIDHLYQYSLMMKPTSDIICNVVVTPEWQSASIVLFEPANTFEPDARSSKFFQIFLQPRVVRWPAPWEPNHEK